MSDPVTNVAIEDVLSSIRRLVSEDARVRPMPSKTDPEWQADQVEAQIAAPSDRVEKLVLTPALRVADPVDPAPVDDLPDDADLTDEADVTLDASDQPDDAVYDNVAPFEPETVLAAHDHDMSDLAPSDDATAHSTDQSDAEPSDPVIWSELGDVTLESMTEALSWEDHHAGPAAPAAARQGDLADAEVDEKGDDLVASVMAATQDIAEPDSAYKDAPQSTNAPSEPADDVVFSSVRDSAEPAAHRAFVDRQSHESDASESLFDADDTFIDEEMLRELVTDIVRQELQGALGERITRNVRKLVRREIHRALTSHELD